MKKILVSMLVLALCAPAMADVTVTGVDQGGGVLRITVSPSGGDTVRGVGLLLGLDAANTGDGVVASATVSGLNTNIDYLATNGTGGVAGETPAGEGHPLADPAGPGVATLPAADVSLCSGYLDPSGGQAGYAVDSFFDITYTLTSDTLVTIDLDTLRGGIVGDIAGAVTIATPTVLLGGGTPECVNSGAAFYADWLAWGSPDCWCYAKNCLGDFDGLAQGSAFAGFTYVFTNDLNAFLPAYNIKEPPKGPGITPGQICADFNRDAQGSAFAGFTRVFTNDLNILLANYNIKEPTKGPGIGDCTGPDYNFFVAP